MGGSGGPYTTGESMPWGDLFVDHMVSISSEEESHDERSDAVGGPQVSPESGGWMSGGLSFDQSEDAWDDRGSSEHW